MEQNDHTQESKRLEESAKFEIISIDDDGMHEKKKILDDAKDEITRLYNEFRVWLANNVNASEVTEKYERLKQETSNLINRTKDSIDKFNEREDVVAGKDKAKALGSKLVHLASDGLEEIMKNDYISKAVDNVSDTIDHVRKDERLHSGIKKMKKETLKIAESAFHGLQRVLDTEDDQKDDRKG